MEGRVEVVCSWLPCWLQSWLPGEWRYLACCLTSVHKSFYAVVQLETDSVNETVFFYLIISSCEKYYGYYFQILIIYQIPKIRKNVTFSLFWQILRHMRNRKISTDQNQIKTFLGSTSRRYKLLHHENI